MSMSSAPQIWLRTKAFGSIFVIVQYFLLHRYSSHHRHTTPLSYGEGPGVRLSCSPLYEVGRGRGWGFHTNLTPFQLSHGLDLCTMAAEHGNEAGMPFELESLVGHLY